MMSDIPLYHASGSGFEVPSKKNTMALRKGGGFFNHKSKEMEAITWHLKNKKAKQAGPFPINIPVSIKFMITGNNRNDYNNQLTTICDCLEKAGVVENDRLIRGTEKSWKDIKKKGQPDFFSVALYELNV
jgi:Holliday junction resolvase RusA-like endonuclease